jgi:hypothetical protein
MFWIIPAVENLKVLDLATVLVCCHCSIAGRAANTAAADIDEFATTAAR